MSVSEINNNFGNRLFNQIQTKTFDALISPFSLYYICNLLYVASSLNTKDELQSLLGFHPDDDNSQHIKDLIKIAFKMNSLKGDTDNIFQCDTSFYLDESYKPFVKDNYKKLMEKIGDLALMDFQHNSIREISIINDIVNRMSRTLIPQLLSFNDITSNTKLILLNVIYFKNRWLHPFKTTNTETKAFCSSKGQYLPLPMMNQTEDFIYYENQHFQVVSLPYENNKFNIDIFLPRNLGKQNLDMMLRETCNFNWNQIGMIFEQKVNLTLPKFTHRLKLHLKEHLQDMNLRRIFQTGKFQGAEFTNLVNIPPEDSRHPYVSNIIQECVVIVDETGTEAAAATAAVMLNYSAKKEEERIKVFNANHSFLYKIRNVENGLVIFQGLFDGNSS